MAIVSCCQGEMADEQIEVRDVDVLKTLGRCAGTTDRKWLRGLLASLAAPIEISQDGCTYSGLLLDVTLQSSGRLLVRFSRAQCQLFTSNYTKLSFAGRNTFKRKPLALWITAFYTSHLTPHPMHVQTLHDLCGSENRSIGSFRRELEESLNRAVKGNAIESWGYDKNGLIKVRLVLSDEQRKRIAKKAASTSKNKPTQPAGRANREDSRRRYVGPSAQREPGSWTSDRPDSLGVFRPYSEELEDDIPW
jgi:hypothetical protein